MLRGAPATASRLDWYPTQGRAGHSLQPERAARTKEVAPASHRCHASRVDEPSMAGQQLILIVEDEKDLLDLLQFNLRQGGFDTVTAPDGEKALELLRQRIPDLVMLDLMLPGVPGIEVCRQLKSS